MHGAGSEGQSGRIRALVIAEAANPDWPSVPLVGWSHAEALSRLVDVHVVTQVRNREAIELFGWRAGEQFTTIDTEDVAGPVWKAANFARTRLGLGWTSVTAAQALSYSVFERRLWQKFGASIEAGEYDVVHRITPLSPTAPSLIAKRAHDAGVPFILGPLNGAVPWPREFRDAQHKEGEFLSYVRGLHRYLPGYRNTRKFSAAIIAGSRAILDEMPAAYLDRCVYAPENAIDPARFNKRAKQRDGGPLRVCFVGRLVPYKGADMLLEAAAPLLREGAMQLDILGDGPELERLRALAEELQIADAVALPGWVEHRELQERLIESEVFAFPSVREFGGGVVLEVMALGIVPVVLDYAGPSELVTEETGFKVPLGKREEVVSGFRERLATIASDRKTLQAMGERARARVEEHFTWDVKAQQTRDVYRWVLGRAAKPERSIPLGVT